MKITEEIARKFCIDNDQNPDEITNPGLSLSDLGEKHPKIVRRWQRVQEELTKKFKIFDLFISHYLKNEKFNIRTPISSVGVNFRMDECKIEPVSENKE